MMPVIGVTVEMHTTSNTTISMDDYSGSSTSCDLWKSTNLIHLPQDVSRSSSCLDWNTHSSIDYDQMPNIFTLTSYTPSYKDLTVIKEKGSDAVADVLLSLKNAVVRPSNPMPSLHSPYSHQSRTFNNGPTNSPNFAPPPPPPHHHPPPPPPPHHDQQILTPGYGNQYHSGFQNIDASSVGHTAAYNHPHSHSHSQHFQSLQPSNSVYHQPSGVTMAPSQEMSIPCYPTQEQSKFQKTSYVHDNAPYEPYNVDYNNVYRSEHAHQGRQFNTNNGSSSSSTFTVYNTPWKKQKPERRHYRNGCRTEPGKGSNLCRLCGKTYARPSTLKTHLRTHSGEKPYRCSSCHKAFSQAANLTAHVRTHSGEKPFKCMICNRSFSQSSSVTTHMRTHSGERPYKCRLCKKAFADSSTLTKHLRIHSGEKPYQCKLCLLRFSQSGNLNRHMRVHNNV
ncbi:protein glass-like [Ptychodera flava]|uniref:protein glass-like n=1 Tax=Ptychodera flava TaxID=63121 RepID=UPI00396A6AEE